MLQNALCRRSDRPFPVWLGVALSGLALCVFSDLGRASGPVQGPAWAWAGPAEAERARAPGERMDEPAPARRVELTGTVFFPAGRGAEGAVVVSSAGGSAKVDPDGAFVLALELDESIEAVALTAVASEAEGNWSAQRRVEGLAGLRSDDAAPVGELLLSLTEDCDAGWLPTFGGMPGTESWVLALCAFDDGSGPALYAGGTFESIGGSPARYAARWDGTRWSPLGQDPDFMVRTLTVWDDGAGPALYAGGYAFTGVGGQTKSRVARWDGVSWSELGTGLSGASVSAVCGFEDRFGRALYVAGAFSAAGGVQASNIARWDGSSWSALGEGIAGPEFSGVNALAAFDDGSGPALFVGGYFTSAGGQPANHIARWDGTAWSTLGQGVTGALDLWEAAVYVLAALPENAGPALYVGGSFQMAGGVTANSIARWDGSGWSALGQGVDGGVQALQVVQEGAGLTLYAGGIFFSAGGQPANHVARWDGNTWSPLAQGVSGDIPFVAALGALDLGSGSRLIAGGAFTEAGNLTVNSVAQWDGSAWSGLGEGVSARVLALCVFDDGAGPAVYAGGWFTAAGGQPALHVARWNGGTWTALGQGVNGTVTALCVFNDGTGPALYAGGDFTEAGGLAAHRIARWNGTTWSALGLGVNQWVETLCVFDDGDGPALYAGGAFTAAGGQVANRIARWDGSAWSALGAGTANGTSQIVQTLRVFDDGTGSALYAGGIFTAAGGLPANRIARWNGQSWSALGTGLNGMVGALCVFDDGAGPDLYVGGVFTSAGGLPANRIARWDGSAWSALGTGIPGQIRALSAMDDGSGAALYVGGNFVSAGGQAARRIARWDGTTWSPLGSGVNDEVYALAVAGDGAGSGLYVGGDFTSSPGGDSYVAEWAGCPAPGFDVLPGCFANPAVLSSPSAGLILGSTAVFDLQSQAAVLGIGVLHLGPSGVDGAGCGQLLPGLGELLLAVDPQPILVALSVAPMGQAQFQLPIPNQPQWAGLSLTVQGAVVSLSLPGFPLEFSNALAGALAL